MSGGHHIISNNISNLVSNVRLISVVSIECPIYIIDNIVCDLLILSHNWLEEFQSQFPVGPSVSSISIKTRRELNPTTSALNPQTVDSTSSSLNHRASTPHRHRQTHRGGVPPYSEESAPLIQLNKWQLNVIYCAQVSTP